ncbi:hypothetical protein HWV62_31989, partial [Athelia sp. TMB]
MASHRGPPLSRLSISGPPQHLNFQQPMGGFDPRNQPMYSPALPTATQQGYYPQYQMNGGPMQTPMQSMFNVQAPSAPSRPAYAGHRGQASMAQLAAAGIHPPNGMNGMPMSPITPMGQGFHPSQMQQGMSFGGGGPAFVPRNRRTPSMNIGGPPKAVLGGPNRKVSPLPPPVEVAPAPAPKGKKMTVKFPQETIAGDDAEKPSRAPWARTPLPISDVPEQLVSHPPEVASAECFPSDAERYDLPNSLEVFLPGKGAWEAIKKMDMEEKLQRLGVEPGSGTNLSHILGPHGRAASISSPADSALLYYKLNKLQQSQNTSPAHSLSASPYPPFGNNSPSPSQFAQMQSRHGQSLSMAQPPTQHSPVPITPSFNPFGPGSTIGDSPDPASRQLEEIHAPQGRIPVTAASLSLPPGSQSRPDSRPNFALGFGLEVPEEAEEDEEYTVAAQDADEEVNGDGDDGYEQEGYDEHDEQEDDDRDTDVEDNKDDTTTAGHSRLHSRHVSNALSLASVGGNSLPMDIPEDPDQDAIGEWTGSEDLHFDGGSGDEGSIGEWSNPSDEERARQDRAQRRILRRTRHEEGPRRLPNFPVPPENTMVGGRVPEDDIISNPSEEGHIQDANHIGFLGVTFERSSSAGSGLHDRPLPPLPHSRSASGQLSVSAYDPALAHSRAPSQTVPPSSGHVTRPSLTGSNGPSLNPFAKPFVFGAAKSQSGSWAPGAPAATSSPPPPAPKALVFGHARTPSFGKPLNAAAMEFKPGGFTFQPPPAAPKLAFPPPSPRPLPQPPVFESPARAMQGREKRQRRSSVGSIEVDDEEGRSNMSSFRFPSGDSPNSVRRSAPTTPQTRRQSSLNAAAQPFTFSGFSTIVPQDGGLAQTSVETPGGGIAKSSTPKSESAEIRNLPIPPSTRQKRAPIPLDFKHPTHSNTVPAGLFKAVVNGDERTRRTVRSRLGSRDFDSRRPSLDDLTVPSISRKISRPKLSTEPMLPRELSGDLNDFNDFFSSPARRSSLPDANQRATSPDSPLSDISFTGNLTKRFENQHLEQQMENMFEEKMAKQRKEFARQFTGTEAKLDALIALYQRSLEKQQAYGPQDSQLDARGEIDFEEIRNVIREGQLETSQI